MTKLSLACGMALSTVVAVWSSSPQADATAIATTAAAPASATAPAKAAAPKLVCENVSDTGSHMRHRVCLTPEQMAQRRKDSQQAAQDLQQRAQPVNSSGKPPI